MVTIVLVYHDQVQPHFTYNLSINALVAIFSTILRATLVFVVSEVIGQSKWRWMKGSPHPLRDIERFDDAGKGAWGSLKILFTVWKPTPTMLGAFVVVASYAIGPFSQQATTTYSCERTIPGTAKIAIAENVRLDWRELDMPPGMAAAAITGLMFGGDNSSVHSSNLFKCDTGNCTFSAPYGITHSSVGVCNKCVDANEDVEALDRGGDKTDYQFQGNSNFSISWVNGPKETDERLNGFKLDHFRNRASSILTFSAARCADDNGTDDWPIDARHYNQKYGLVSATDGTRPDRDAGIVGVNCTLSACVYNYNAVVTNGVLKEHVVSHEPIKTRINTNNGDVDVANTGLRMIEPCFFRGKWYDSSNISEAPRNGNWTTWRMPGEDLDLPSSCARVATGFEWTLELFITSKLSGACQYHWSSISPDAGGRSGVPVGPNQVLQKVICDSWWLDTLYNNGNTTQGSIKRAYDGLAAAMTNYMRTNTWSDSEIRNEPPAFVTGSATQALICIRANWQWLLYPAILLALAAILLVEACIRSHLDREQQPVWKSAILPFLFYNIKPRGVRSTWDEGDRTREAEPLLKLRDLELLADRTVARFDGDRRAPGFVVENVGDRNDKGQTASRQC
ncbi:hypothetical protein CMUS01_14748 [Colletotrichum musicola]|uniref:Uncharacterized protein n=1 Tax=Colletotrichum musicola TaxID=2175873 RepID=A0A8H6J1W4_9PEZI|nr:hypothetical protein CMUS01_14748 [Colletotrichum musicola]